MRLVNGKGDCIFIALSSTFTVPQSAIQQPPIHSHNHTSTDVCCDTSHSGSNLGLSVFPKGTDSNCHPFSQQTPCSTSCARADSNTKTVCKMPKKTGECNLRLDSCRFFSLGTFNLSWKWPENSQRKTTTKCRISSMVLSGGGAPLKPSSKWIGCHFEHWMTNCTRVSDLRDYCVSFWVAWPQEAQTVVSTLRVRHSLVCLLWWGWRHTGTAWHLLQCRHRSKLEQRSLPGREGRRSLEKKRRYFETF